MVSASFFVLQVKKEAGLHASFGRTVSPEAQPSRHAFPRKAPLYTSWRIMASSGAHHPHVFSKEAKTPDGSFSGTIRRCLTDAVISPARRKTG